MLCPSHIVLVPLWSTLQDSVKLGITHTQAHTDSRHQYFLGGLFEYYTVKIHLSEVDPNMTQSNSLDFLSLLSVLYGKLHSGFDSISDHSIETVPIHVL